MSMMELVQAKEAVPSRQTEIEGFEMHIKAVMDAFLNSLAINAEAEERVKVQFSSTLESKDKTIMSLQERAETMQAILAEAQAVEQESQNRAAAAEKEAAAAKRSAADKTVIVDMLTVKLNEAEGKLGGYDTIKEAVQTAQEKAATQEQAAREREQLERSHNAEIKALYEKMSANQDQIATLTKNQIEKKEKPERKGKAAAKPEVKKSERR